MKQNISVDDLNQLSKKGKERLRKWWKPTFSNVYYNFYDSRSDLIYCCEDEVFEMDVLPLLSIGQMIEFLDERSGLLTIDQIEQSNDLKSHWGVQSFMEELFNEGEPIIEPKLCDALWKAVKQVLEK